MKLSIVDAIKNALDTAMERDEKVIIIGEDVGEDGGVFRATDGLNEKYGNERVIDTPLSEAGIAGTGLGLAISGIKPVCEIQFMGFIYPAFDHIISHISRIRTRTRSGLSAPMVIRMPYGGGIHAPEHHSESTEAILCHTPGIKVVVPSNPEDAKGLLLSAIEDPDPVLFLEPKRIYRAFKQEVKEGYYTIPLGKARLVQEGSDVTVICWGAMVPLVQLAFKESDVSAEIIDLRTLSPLDSEAVMNSVKKTGRCVIVHEAPHTCGLGAEISAQIMEKCLMYVKAPVKRVTGADTVFPLYKLEEHYLPSEKRILAAVKEVMEF